jgi:hypothetical protein
VTDDENESEDIEISMEEQSRNTEIKEAQRGACVKRA